MDPPRRSKKNQKPRTKPVKDGGSSKKAGRPVVPVRRRPPPGKRIQVMSQQKRPNLGQVAQAWLSPCSSKYLASLYDPFEGPDDACLPLSPSMPSQKARAFARGTFSPGQGAGTNGVGYLLARLEPANDLPSAWATTAGFTGSTASPITATAGATVLAVNNNSPYAAADFVPLDGVRWRPVSFGIRCRYTGTEFNRGGTIMAFEHPNHGDVVGSSYDSLLQYDNAVRYDVSDGRWIELNWTPKQHTGETGEYTSQTGPVTAAPTIPSIILMVNMPALAGGVLGATFDFELVQNFEFIGKITRGRTESTADPMGVAVVQGTLNDAYGQLDREVLTADRSKGDSLKVEKSIWQKIGDFAKKTVSGFGDFITSPEGMALMGKAAVAMLA